MRIGDVTLPPGEGSSVRWTAAALGLHAAERRDWLRADDVLHQLCVEVEFSARVGMVVCDEMSAALRATG